jgi:hypothetical protein
MKPVAGLWIDHQKAVVVTLSDEGERIEEFVSYAEQQPGRINEKYFTVSFESQLVKADDRQQRGFTEHINKLYETVLSRIRRAQSVLIFGPGEAKGELKKIMEYHSHTVRDVVVETADKMTDNQIAAKIHQHYALGKQK